MTLLRDIITYLFQSENFSYIILYLLIIIIIKINKTFFEKILVLIIVQAA